MRVRIPETTVPIATALARTVQVATSAFVVGLETDTTILRVYAISKDIYVRWGTSDQDYANAQNFDEVVPAGQILDFGVPSGYTYVSFVSRESGGTVVATQK